ncbi:hypothetical protein RHGRI_016981 [Rhododendron griersonianum]|uniref:CCHC-type domain-containing protein n=1 Tax=Rhododendron griersonianum TaxID=479676 RepID=A0AAV6JW73_9ERIC|nr:hypothetical protein RHGRI_016981 [Rhododendron griersonianum]
MERIERGESSSNISGFQPCPKRRRMYRAWYYKDIGACFKCGKMGHLMKDCPKGTKRSTSKPMVATNSGQSSGTKRSTSKPVFLLWGKRNLKM